MENFTLEKCIVKDYFNPTQKQLVQLEKPELLAKLTSENDGLKKKLKDMEGSITQIESLYKEKLFSLTKEVDELKAKLAEKEALLDPKRQFKMFIEQNGFSSNGSISSQDDAKEQEEEKPKPTAEEEKAKASKMKMIHMIRDMSKSPSVILKSRDAEYYDKSFTRVNDAFESKAWLEVLNSLHRDPKEKVLIKIHNAVQDFIPKRHRPHIWPLLIGNNLKIRRSIYDQFSQQIEICPIDEKVRHQIKEDLARTYPQLKSFNRGEALNDELQRLLELFHFYRPDVGYVQGIAYPASLLLLYLDHYHAFKCLTNLIICRPFLKNLFKFDLEEVQLVCRVFDQLLKQKVPNVHKHLERLEINPELYLIEWLVTLFCRNFHIDDTAKIWDMFLLEGEVAFIKVSLKLFQMIENNLIKKDYAETLYYLRSCTEEVDTTLLFKNVLSSRLSQEKLQKIFEKERKKKEKKDTRSMSMKTVHLNNTMPH